MRSEGLWVYDFATRRMLSLNLKLSIDLQCTIDILSQVGTDELVYTKTTTTTTKQANIYNYAKIDMNLYVFLI